MDDKTHGLHIDVYRHPHGDCTNGGVSAKVDGLTVVGIIDETVDRNAVLPMPPMCTPHAVNDRRPAAVLVKQNVTGRDDWYVRPLDPRGGRPMFGGNLAYSSDSRIGSIVGGNGGGLRIHDRYE